VCRLFAVTASTSQQQRQIIAHSALLQGNADHPAQRDGWGITDGEGVFKGQASYRDYSPKYWMGGLDPDAVWMSHVRNASYGTELSQAAAHPYIFEHFVGAHNGNFRNSHAGFSASGIAAGEVINTDTWRVFYTLNKKLKDGLILENIIDEHLSQYDDDSAFVLMLLQNKKLHVCRGPKTREMFVGKYGDGLIFHTDIVVLKTLSDLGEVFGLPVIEDIQELPELTYLQTEYKSNEFDIRTLDYKPVATQTTQTYYTTTRYHQGQRSDSAATQKNGKWMRVVSESVPISPTSIEGRKLELYLKIRQELRPMRDGLTFSYIKTLIENGMETILSHFCEDYGDLAIYELEYALEEVRKHPLTEEEKSHISKWNKAVSEVAEGVLFVASFGSGTPFWKLSNADAILEEI
jgi:hypothetical protein